MPPAGRAVGGATGCPLQSTAPTKVRGEEVTLGMERVSRHGEVAGTKLHPRPAERREGARIWCRMRFPPFGRGPRQARMTRNRVGVNFGPVCTIGAHLRARSVQFRQSSAGEGVRGVQPAGNMLHVKTKFLDLIQPAGKEPIDLPLRAKPCNRLIVRAKCEV